MGEEGKGFTAPQSQQDVIMQEVVTKAQQVYMDSYEVKRLNGFIVVIRKADNKRVFRSKTITKYEDFMQKEVLDIINRARSLRQNHSTAE